MRRFFSMTCLLAIAGLVGCEKPMVDPMERLLVSPNEAQSLGYRIHWQSDLGTSDGRIGTNTMKFVRVLGDVVVVVEKNNLITVFDAYSGRVRWREIVGASLERLRPPERFQNMLVLSSETRVYAFNVEDGDPISEADLETVVNTGPLVDRNLAVFGTPKGRLVAQDLKAGYVRWRYQMRESVVNTPQLISSLKAVATDVVGGVVLINPLSGQLLWRNRTWGRILAPAAFMEGLIFVASEDQTLYAFEASTGRIQWKYLTQEPLRTAPSVFKDQLFQFVPNEGIVVLDAFTGKERWRKSDFKKKPFFLENRRLYFHRYPWIERLEEKIGEQNDRILLPKVHMVIPSDPIDGELYVVNQDGRILKLSKKAPPTTEEDEAERLMREIQKEQELMRRELERE